LRGRKMVVLGKGEISAGKEPEETEAWRSTSRQLVPTELKISRQ
jgi:hypothetical protein